MHRLWITFTVLVGLCLSVNLQIAVPMYPAPYMMPPPPPVGIPVPFPVPMPVVVTTKPTTTTTKRPSQQAVGIPLPYPVPMAVPYAVPQPMVPVCCIPQPRPLPPRPPPPPLPPPPMMPAVPFYPMPAPPPVVVVPFPPQFPRRLPPYRRKPFRSDSSDSDNSKSRRTSDSSSTDTDDSRSSSSGELWRKRAHVGRKGMKHKIAKRRRKLMKYRKFLLSESDTSDNKLIRPMLTYISKNGDVKYQKRISKDDADKLMGRSILSGIEKVANSRRAQSQKIQQLNSQEGAPRLGETKQIIFKAPNDKKISNISVSVHVEK